MVCKHSLQNMCISATVTSHAIFNFFAPAPTVSIEIIDGGVAPIIGERYTLTCGVSGDSFTTYQWRKNSSVPLHPTGKTLSFTQLKLSDAGSYTCGNGSLFSDRKVLNLQS